MKIGDLDRLDFKDQLPTLTVTASIFFFFLLLSQEPEGNAPPSFSPSQSYHYVSLFFWGLIVVLAYIP